MPEFSDIQIVDRDDRPVGGGQMDDIHRQGLIHRIVVVILKDPSGNILLQLRSNNVETNKNKWDASVAGHVDEGEDYLTAAKRETKEELNLENLDLREVAYFYNEIKQDWRDIKRFRKVYEATIPSDTKFQIDPYEISQARWFSPAELEDLIRNSPEDIVADFVTILRRLGSENN